MNSEVLKKLNDKLVILINEIEDLKEDKKAYNASTNEVIKGFMSKLKAISMTIKKDDPFYLLKGYEEHEVAQEFGISLSKEDLEQPHEPH